MELAYGRAIFDTCGRYESDPHAIPAMLEAAVTDMQDRASQLAGRQPALAAAAPAPPVHPRSAPRSCVTLAGR